MKILTKTLNNVITQKKFRDSGVSKSWGGMDQIDFDRPQLHIPFGSSRGFDLLKVNENLT